ncbi:MAG: methyltransferase type 12 [Comamonadaceae bacterium PBBC2]|nr:MAG: methyltransferase type 12 [Comamonadaceae bacterium PBBC2]
MISRDEVIYAYRLLLGREPENDTVVNHYATEVADLRALRELFINSTEFQTSVASVLAPRPPKPSFNGPAMRVELNAPAEKLQALFSKTSHQWHHLGETEPHWSVLTNDSYFQDTFHMNRDAFYASGKSEVAMFEATLMRAGVQSSRLKRCLELGCGVGRVTAPLASRFAEVVGVDISAAHLRVAQEHFAAQGIGNVQCKHLDSVDGVAALGNFDLLYSRIVLQHNPPPVMQHLLADLLDQLNPGGVAFFQVPTYKAGYRFAIDDYLSIDNHTTMEMHFLPQAALLDLLAQKRCRLLEMREDDAIGLSMTSVSNTFLVQKENASQQA